MKKVLIFSLAYYPHVGGAEVAIKEITDRITDIEFHMVTMRFARGESREETIGNVRVHRVGLSLSYFSKILFVPLAAWKGRMLHKKHTFSGAWAMMSYMTFPIVLMRLLGTRIPYALTLQEGDPFEYVFKRWYIRLFKPLLTLGFKRASVVQVISNFLSSWARTAGFQGQVEVIPNAVDVRHFSQTYSLETLQELKEKLGKRGGDRCLITTSRLVKKNAVDVVIRALSKLPPNVYFLILGIGTDEVKLRELARSEGVEGRVKFLGQVDHAELPKYLAISDIFIRPSRSEGMGNSFIEAMAAGIPVIGTREGGIADFLFDAKHNPDKAATGFVVDKDSPEQIAAAIEHILIHPEEVSKTIENAKALVVAKYDWNLIAHDMRSRVFDKLS